jgi:hypothetical protein
VRSKGQPGNGDPQAEAWADPLTRTLVVLVSHEVPGENRSLEEDQTFHR